jgi:phospholipid/cholesterol/gamma-HCH transport system ATP-binding protein
VASLLFNLQNVSLRFGQEPVFASISLKIQRGEKLVIVGPSGSGKTSLIKLLAGLVDPTEGDIFLEDKALNRMDGEEKLTALKKMGMLFQKNALFDSLTCAENISFPLQEAAKKNETEIQEIVEFFLNAVGIPHAKNLYPDEISGGMQKRLGIARALALDPEIVFYDDPTAGLDPITSRKIIDLINDMQIKKKSTVIAITNDMNRAYQLADRIIMCVDHELIDTGTPEQTKKSTEPRVHQFIKGITKGPLNDSL